MTLFAIGSPILAAGAGGSNLGAAGALLGWLGAALLFGTATALLTWVLVSTVLKRFRASVHAVLWLIVIAKFLLPVGPGWSYSLASLLSAATGNFRPDTVSPHANETGVAQGTALWLWIWPASSAASEAAPALSAASPQAATARGPDWISILALSYLCGLVFIAARRVHTYRRILREVRELPSADESTKALVERLCVSRGFRRLPTVRISDRAPAPFVLGVRRPTLVLASHNLTSPDECEAVVLHELAHLRRHDLLVRYVQWLAGTVLYFWPVVAWVNRRIDLAREAACDEWALRHGPLSPAEYARCLLRCTQPTRFGWSLCASAAMAANVSHVERRIEMILNSPASFRRNRLLALLGAAAACGWTGFLLSGASAALPTNPSDGKQKAKPARQSPLRSSDAVRFFFQSAADVADEAEAAEAEGAAKQPRVMMFSSDGVNLEGRNATFQIALSDDAGADAGPHSAMFVLGDGGDFPIHFSFDEEAGDVGADHDARLIALAMRDPAATLEHYPKADLDGDGTLSVEEAAALLSTDEPPFGPRMALGAPVMIKLEAQVGPDGVLTLQTAGDDESGGSALSAHQIHIVAAPPDAPAGETTVRKTVTIRSEDGEVVTETTEQVGDQPARTTIVRKSEGDSAEPSDVPILSGVPLVNKMFSTAGHTALSWESLDSEMPPQLWLLQGAKDMPTAEEIARYTDVATSTSLRNFLRQHPDADTNHDSKLTVEERDAFRKKMQSSRRERLLKRFPQADADGDGILTDQELRTFMRARHAKGGTAEAGDADTQVTEDGNRRMIIKRRGGVSEEREIEVHVGGQGEATDGPR